MQVRRATAPVSHDENGRCSQWGLPHLGGMTPARVSSDHGIEDGQTGDRRGKSPSSWMDAKSMVADQAKPASESKAMPKSRSPGWVVGLGLCFHVGHEITMERRPRGLEQFVRCGQNAQTSDWNRTRDCSEMPCVACENSRRRHNLSSLSSHRFKAP